MIGYIEKEAVLKALVNMYNAVRDAPTDSVAKVGHCNQCAYYMGVHGSKGHAPCRFWNIGGVMDYDFCSRWTAPVQLFDDEGGT